MGRVATNKGKGAMAETIKVAPITRGQLLKEARALKSEHGENPEYDRALAELIYFTAGGRSIESVAREIRAK